MNDLVRKAMDGAPVPQRLVRFSEVALRYGDIVLRFRGERTGTRLGVPEDHLPYVVQAGTPADHEVVCAFGPIALLDAPVVFTVRDEDGDAWDVRRAEDGTEEIVLLTPGTLSPWLAVTTDPGFRTSRYQYWPLSGEADLVPLGHQVDQYLTARILGLRGGVLLHACALLHNGGAYIFSGHSGAGKSTMSGLGRAAGAEILSDDRTIVAFRDGVPVAAGTPWQGSNRPGIPGFAPVRGIFLLSHASDDTVVPLAKSRAFAELQVRTVHPSTIVREVEAVTRSVERLACTVPAAQLRFRPTPAAFRLALAFAGAAIDAD